MLTPEALRRYEVQVDRYFKKWGDSEQVQAALGEADELLSLGREPEPTPYLARHWLPPGTRRGNPDAPRWFAWREVHRLLNPAAGPDRQALSGAMARGKFIPRRRPTPVSSGEVLRAVLPLFLVADIDPARFASDKALTHELAASVFRLRPLHVRWTARDRKADKQITAVRPLGSKALKYFGQEIRDKLGVWALMAVEQIKKDDQDRVDRRQKIRKAYPQPEASPLSPRRLPRTARQPQPSASRRPAAVASSAPVAYTEVRPSTVCTALLPRDISILVADEMTEQEYAIASDLVRKHGEQWHVYARILWQQQQPS